MKTRTYPITCQSCGGTGRHYTSTVAEKCPACRGTRVVNVTETEHDPATHVPQVPPGTVWMGTTNPTDRPDTLLTGDTMQ